MACSLLLVNPMSNNIYRYLLLGLLAIFLVKPVDAQILHWTQTNSPPTKAFGLVPFRKTIFAPTHNGLFSSNDSGTTWIAAPGILGSTDILSMRILDTSLFAQVKATNITDVELQFKSSDGGITWDSSGYVGIGVHFQWSKTMEVVGGFILDNNYSLIYNNGKSYRWLDSAFPGQILTAVPGDSLLLVLIDSLSNRHLLLSSDFGNTWKTLSIFDSSIYPFAAIGDTFFAYTKSGLFRSTDKCSSWVNIYNDTSIRLRTLLGDTLFATTKKDGIVISINQGNYWSVTTNTGLPSFDFTSFVIGDNKIYVEFTNGDIYRTTFPEISKVENSGNDLEPRLAIYPNPLSSSGKITYSLPNRGIISLTIYDALGRITLKPVINEIQESGLHEIPTGTMSLSPGIYSCKLSFGYNKKVAKLVVVH